MTTPSTQKARACDGIMRALCKAARLPIPTPEYRFAAPQRQWRMDYAWPLHKVALEVEGGVWTRGRHTRGTGFMKDLAKYNAAASRGWRIVRCTPGTLPSGVEAAAACLRGEE